MALGSAIQVQVPGAVLLDLWVKGAVENRKEKNSKRKPYNRSENHESHISQAEDVA